MEWIKRTKQTQANQAAVKETVARIANILQNHADNGVITYEQLIKIQNLATNQDKLTSVLRWL